MKNFGWEIVKILYDNASLYCKLMYTDMSRICINAFRQYLLILTMLINALYTLSLLDIYEYI